jgi:hypothetical protein
MKAALYLSCVTLLLLSGCGKQTGKNKKVRVIDAKRVRRTELIIPSTELSALSCKQDECAFSRTTFKAPRKISSKEQARQFEARLVDIPIPVASTATHACADSGGCKLLAYSSTLSAEEIKKFYIQEMERFGWQQEYLFEGNELLLNFKKPQRFCSVSVRPTKKTWERSKSVSINLFVS